VITNVDLDHTEWFGNTKAEIAREKVGIVKPGGTAIIGDTDPDIVALLERESTRLGAERVLTKGFDFACDSNRLALAGRVLTLRTPTTSYPGVFVPLHGSHQGENAATALVAAETFLGGPLEPDVVLAGFAAVQNPGRMEVVSRGPLVLLDGAHNPAGARTAAATLSEEFAANPGRIIVLGLLKGRDPGAMLDALEAERAKLVIVVAPPSPRAMEPEAIVAAALPRGIAAVVARSITAANDHPRDEAADDDVVLITGSLYLVGSARAILKPRR
jgi:dihydrofolate synthase/folylpolyglutamate synthase